MPSAAVRGQTEQQPGKPETGATIITVGWIIRVIVSVYYRRTLHIGDRRLKGSCAIVRLKRDVSGHCGRRWRDYGRQDRIRNALLHQVNDLIVTQVIRVSGTIDESDDGVIAGFGLLEFEDLLDAIRQYRRRDHGCVLG